MDGFVSFIGIALPKIKVQIISLSFNKKYSYMAVCFSDHPYYHEALTPPPIKENIYTKGQLLVGSDPQQSAGSKKNPMFRAVNLISCMKPCDQAFPQSHSIVSMAGLAH